MNEKFELEVLTRLAVIENKIDDYKQIKQKSEDAYNLSKKNEESIKELKDRNRWLKRTTLGSVIAGIVGIIFIFIKISMNIN